MSKKAPNTDHIQNELANSVFFKQRPTTPAKPEAQEDKPSSPAVVQQQPAAPIRSVERKALKFFLPLDCVRHLQMMHFRVNREGGKIEKSELVELAIKLLGERLGTQAPALDNKEALEKYLREG